MILRGFSKIWVIAILAAVLAGGFYARQKLGTPKEVSQNNISIIYTSENFAWGENIQRIEISKDGKITRSDKTAGEKREGSRTLSGKELEELYGFIISQKFFDLSADLTNSLCADAPTEYLEITIGTKTHQVGGNCVEDQSFKAIVEKLTEKIQVQGNNNETAGWKSQEILRKTEILLKEKFPSCWPGAYGEFTSYFIEAEEDVTGDNIKEAMVRTGCMGAYTMHLVLLRLINGEPVPVSFIDERGRALEPKTFLLGSSLMHYENFKMKGDMQAVYQRSGQALPSECTIDYTIEAFKWNATKEAFQLDEATAQNIKQQNPQEFKGYFDPNEGPVSEPVKNCQN